MAMKRLLASSIATLTLLGTSAAFAAEGTVPYANEPFRDVKANHINFQAIEYLRTNKVIRGYLDGTYKPGRQITRAEFAQLLTNPFVFRAGWKTSCLDDKLKDGSETVFFPDVQRDSWYAEAVCTAKSYSLINGYPDGTYRPLRPINFVEGAKIATRVFAIDVIEDSGEKWYEPYVRRLDELKAIPTTIKRFDQPLTRGDMAEIVYRLKAKDTTKASTPLGNLQ